MFLFAGRWCSFARMSVPQDTIARSSITAFTTSSILPSSRLDGAELEKLSSSSVADALKFFSGVQIKDYGGIGGLKTVNVRSLGAQHVAVFLDGVRIENAQNGQVDLGRYSLDNMEAVELYNAQKADVLQGANEYASGASVYMKSRKPVFKGKDFNLKTRLKAGSFKSVSPSLRYERKTGSLTMSLDGTVLYSKGDYRFKIKNRLEDTTSRRYNDDIRAARAEAGLWASPSGGELQVHLYGYTSERGLPGPVIRRLSDQFSSRDRQWDRNLFAQASFRKDAGKTSFMFSGKASHDYLRYLSDPGLNPAAVYVRNVYREGSLFASSSFAWHPMGWVSFNLALDGRWTSLDCNVTGFSHVERRDTKAVAAFRASPGNLSLAGSVLYTRVKDRKDGPSDPLSNFSPSLAVGWRNGGGTVSLRTYFKSAYRTPTLNELYYVLVGNAFLKPERASQADVGMDLNSDPAQTSVSWKFSVDAYADRVSNKIVAMPAASQFRWSMMNFGKVEGYGVDARLNAAANIDAGRLTALLSYSYQSARDRSDRRRISWNGQIPYTPWHSASAVLGADLKGGRHVSVSALYTGTRYRSADNTRSERLKPWMTVDMTLSRDLKVNRAGNLNIALDVNNLLNRRYEVVTRYPMPGINFMAKITLTI